MTQPTPPATSTEWTWRHNAYTSTARATSDRAEAERVIAILQRNNPGDPVTLMRRTVTEWTPAGIPTDAERREHAQTAGHHLDALCRDIDPDDDQDEPTTAERIVDELIGDYIATACATARAATGKATPEERAAQAAIDRLQHLHLDGWSYRLTPRLLTALREAGLLAADAPRARPARHQDEPTTAERLAATAQAGRDIAAELARTEAERDQAREQLDKARALADRLAGRLSDALGRFRPRRDGTWVALLPDTDVRRWKELLAEHADRTASDDDQDPTTAERLATTAQAARDVADALARTEAERDQLAAALADCVTKAVEYGQQGDGHIAFYLLPTGPIHRAIPLLQDHGITVRPGFDGRAAAGLGSPTPRAQAEG